VLTGVTLLLRLGMQPWDCGQPLLILFLFPIVISAYLGGLGPGLLATVLSGIVSNYFLVAPAREFGFPSPVAFAHWLFMLLAGALVSVLLGELERMRRGREGDAFERQRITTERKIGLAFAGALTLFGIIGIVSYLSVMRLNENSKLVAHSQLVMASIDAIVSTTLETESANRGYLITGEELFAAEYTRAVGRVDGLFQQLRDAVSANPEQLARVGPLADAVHARLAHSTQILDLRRSGGLEAVQRFIGKGPNRPGVSLQARVRARARHEVRRNPPAQRARTRRAPECAGHAGGHRMRQRPDAGVRRLRRHCHSPRPCGSGAPRPSSAASSTCRSSFRD
jgi:CHASE3 domain sensor protein